MPSFSAAAGAAVVLAFSGPAAAGATGSVSVPIRAHANHASDIRMGGLLNCANLELYIEPIPVANDEDTPILTDADVAMLRHAMLVEVDDIDYSMFYEIDDDD